MTGNTTRLITATLGFLASLSCSISFAESNTNTSPRIVKIAEGISHPWGMDWLPSGEVLVTSRDGTLHTVKDGRVVTIPMEGLPEVFAENQGGLLDIAVHPKTSETPLIYMTLSTGTNAANRTVLVRGTYTKGRVTDIETLFRVKPDKGGGEHFGSRLVWLPDNTLLMSIGDGGNPPRRVGGMLAREQAQNLSSHLGSILRLDANGKASKDNPFVNKANVLPEIYSYGHRNIQGMTRDPVTGRIWATEHGPLGGDELNLIKAAANYGWPLASFGRDYETGEPIGKRSIAGAIDPQVVWVPSVATSGLAIYRGRHFPEWEGNLFSGGLVSEDIQRIEVDEKGVAVEKERIKIGERVRDVRLGPDGYLYILTDEENGKILRLEPN